MQSFRDLKKHTDYSFKNKQKFRIKQKKFADKASVIFAFFYLVFIIILFAFCYFYFNSIVLILLITIVLFMMMSFILFIIIKHPYLSYVMVIPLLNVGSTYIIIYYLKHLDLTLIIYMILCSVVYLIVIIVLPINIFRRLTPQLAFIPSIITILSQLVVGYKHSLFNLFTNNTLIQIENQLFNSDYLSLNKREDFIKRIYQICNYLLMERKSELFYSQISLVMSGITLTFIIGGIAVTARTHILNLRANKLWKALIYHSAESTPKYDELLECAYLGGKSYENLILNNPQFLKIIKTQEKNIENEESWKDRIKNSIDKRKKYIINYIKEIKSQ